jgi:predicted flap endonuclease-1-like 5' DNA nuclease
VEDARIEQRKAEQRAAEFAQRAEKLARAVDEQEMADQAEDHGQTAALQAAVLQLEGLVRERTEELNQLRWEQDMAARPTTDGSDSKMLVVLNQQLASARDDNQRLLVRIRELEDRQAELDDDLTRIRGIGPKLVEQLAELGITHLEQIATLDEAALDDVSHPLHAMKGRILKDHWISQAVSLHKRR